MLGKYHFEHHRKEALVNKRRFAAINAFLVMALVLVAGRQYYASRAAFNGLDSAMYNVTGNNVTVKPGDLIQYRSGYINNGATNYSGNFTVDGSIPAHTHFVSQSDGSVSGQTNPYVTSYANTGTSARWVLSGIPASGQPYSAWEGFYYTVQVDANAPASYTISASTRLSNSDGTIQLVSASTSNTTAAPPPAPPAATVSISASSTQVTQNSPLTISWSSQNATACNASGTTWSGARGGSGSEDRRSDTASVRTLTYTMRCDNSTYGGNSASVNVNVVAAPVAPPPVVQPPAPQPPAPQPVPAPSVSINASPATVYQYTGLSVVWSTANAVACNASGTTWSGAKATGSNLSEDRSADTGIIRGLSYVLGCTNSAGVGASSSAGANVIKSAPPTLPTGLRVDSQTASSLRVTWQASTASQGSSVSYYQVRNSGGTAIGTTTQTNFVVNAGLEACKTYSFSVVAVNNQDTASASSSSVSGSTTGCAPSTPPTIAPPAPVQKSSPPPVAGARSNVVGKVSSGTSAPVVVPDTIPPTAPSGLAAHVDADGSTVQLSWTAATDDKGLAGYQVERSTDQQTWTTLTTSAPGTDYADTSTTFSVHYYYRVKAMDKAGNAGPYVGVDITTSAFVANTGSSGTTSINSPDGVVRIQIPSGAVDADVACSLVKDDSNKSLIAATKLLLAAGPYSLSCKRSDGTQVDKFNTLVTIQVSLKAKQLGKFTNIKLYSYDTGNNAWVLLPATLNKKTATLSATISAPIQVAVVGSAKKGVSASLIIIIIFTLALIAGFFFWRLRREQKVEYNEYIRHKYYDL